MRIQINAKPFKKISIILILVFLNCACQNNMKDKIKNDDVIEFIQEDEAMNTAINEANKTFVYFTESFQNQEPAQESFAIKVRFDTPDKGGEHIWVGDLQYDGKIFSGIVNNEPVNTSLVKLGDRITINPMDISDWMYLDKGILKGGYTIRVMRDNLSPEEMKKFDEEIDFIIEDKP